MVRWRFTVWTRGTTQASVISYWHGAQGIPHRKYMKIDRLTHSVQRRSSLSNSKLIVVVELAGRFSSSSMRYGRFRSWPGTKFTYNYHEAYIHNNYLLFGSIFFYSMATFQILQTSKAHGIFCTLFMEFYIREPGFQCPLNWELLFIEGHYIDNS